MTTANQGIFKINVNDVLNRQFKHHPLYLISQVFLFTHV